MEQEQHERFDEATGPFPPVKPSDYLHDRGTDRLVVDIGNVVGQMAEKRCRIVCEGAAGVLDKWSAIASEHGRRHEAIAYTEAASLIRGLGRL